ncbi:hypothetical protein ACFL35_15250 [Candidatus Riflebacteria bacterium]
MLEFIGKLIEWYAVAKATVAEMWEENPLSVIIIGSILAFIFLGLAYKFFFGGGEATPSKTKGKYAYKGKGKGKSGFFSRWKGRKGKGKVRGQEQEDEPRKEATDGAAFKEDTSTVDVQLSSQEGMLSKFSIQRDSMDEMWDKSYGDLEKEFVDGFAQAMGMDSRTISDLKVVDKKLDSARKLMDRGDYKSAISAANRAVKSSPRNIYVHTEARTLRAIAFKKLKQPEKYNIEKQKAAALNYLSFRQTFPRVSEQIENSDPRVKNAMPRMLGYFNHVAGFENKPSHTYKKVNPRLKKAEEKKIEREQLKFEKYVTQYERRLKRRGR